MPVRRRSGSLGGQRPHEVGERGGNIHWLRQSVGAAAPSGGSVHTKWESVGAYHTGQTTPLSLSKASSATSCGSGSMSGSQPLVYPSPTVNGLGVNDASVRS